LRRFFAGSVAGKRILDDIRMEANIGGQKPWWSYQKYLYVGYIVYYTICGHD
jgi:hypothetical protein